jgi:hypothetical protein
MIQIIEETASLKVKEIKTGINGKCSDVDGLWNVKLKLLLKQTVEAHRLVRRRGSHILKKIGSQMAVSDIISADEGKQNVTVELLFKNCKNAVQLSVDRRLRSCNDP